jgi:hypothetical protein
MSLRSWVVRACLVALVAAGTGLGEERKPGPSQTSVTPQAGPVSVMEADLAVTDISFSRIQVNPYAAPRKCYGYLFSYTIKNIGRMTTVGFRYKAETTGPGGYGLWEISTMPVTLKPGESFTIGPSPSNQQNWCVDDVWKSKVKVTADIDNSVHEPNKANNVLEKEFVPPQLKPEAARK